MKRGIVWVALTILIAASLALASCSSSTTPSTSTNTANTPTQTTSVTVSTSSISSTTPTPSSTSTNVITTTSSTGNWWDSLGTPLYGGTTTLRFGTNITQFDLAYGSGQTGIAYAYIQCLFADDWTLNPSVFSYQISWRPSNYINGQLAASWEFTDPTTWTVHLRQGITWQNLPPANGRDFTASDVVYQYDRFVGIGDGFTQPVPSEVGIATWLQLISVTASDKYTVAFTWKTPNVEFILDSMFSYDAANFMESSDAVNQWGNLNDWHHALGTGPFILTDFVDGSSAALIKNPNYWGYDERYPQNKLPYVNSLNVLIIPDWNTALAAMRTGKIDAMDGLSATQARQMAATNPVITQIPVPNAQALSVDPRNDKAPFTDLRVREALQMAIDLPTIAKTYYNGTASPNPSALTSVYETGWGLPYSQWPQTLKDQYTYNPTQAKQLLASAGYPNGFTTDVVADNASDLVLLQIIQSYFAAVNVTMTINPMDTASWTAFVRGHNDDALDFSSAGGLGLSYDPIRQLQRFLPTNGSNYPDVNDPGFNAFYPQAMAATSQDQIKQILTNANTYVAEQHFSISLLQPMTYSLCQPWFKGFAGQNFSITGFQGPPLIGFYAARFWIVPN